MSTHKVKFQVYDNKGRLKSDSIIPIDAEAPTVGQIKAIVNPGTYTDIKSEIFICDDRGHIDDSEAITSPFIKYTINLN